MQNTMVSPTSSALPLWRQFRFTLIVTFVIVTAVPLLLVAFLNISQQTAQIEAQTTRQLESILELKAAQIDLWLSSAEDILDYILADDDYIHEPPTEAPSVDEDAVSQSALTIEATNELIADLITSSTYFDRIIIYDPDGRVVLASNEADVGKLVRLQPYFAGSLAETRYIQPPFFNLTTTELSLVITRQIQDETGQVVYVFAADMNLDILRTIMGERTGLGETGETYLVSRQNSYLLTPSRLEGYALARAYRSEAISASLQGQSGSGIYDNYENPPQQVLGVYRWIPELEAGLIGEVYEEQVLTGTRISQLSIALLELVAVVLATGVGIFVAARVSRPVTQLTTITQQYAEGKLDQRANIRSQNEFGQLASAFNTMAGAIEERETTLKDLNATLEQRVNDRTAQLKAARDEALAAQEIALESSRVKSEFLSTMSHELRTPLNAIEGFTSIMLGGMGIELNPRAEDMVKRVSANSKRLLELINAFLDLSRIEAGRLELVQSPLSPQVLADKWYSGVSVLAEQKGLEFIVTVDPTLPPTLMGDEDALSKIAINLLGNAFKFTAQGSVRLSLQRADDKWAIIVGDTGIGIPSHAREYIFEEFRQVDGSSKRIYGGTGLGLSLVQKLSRAMGGNVALQSEIGEGSIFSVTLPLIMEATSEGGQP